MKGVPTSAGSASLCENEFRAGRGHAKRSLAKQDSADLKPVEAAGFQIGDDGSLGGFEALRLICFVFRGVVELW